MHYVYICGAVSEAANNCLGQSVAGNKFSLNMAKALDAHCGGKLTFISTASLDQDCILQCGEEIWPGKKMRIAKRGRRFLLTDLVQRHNVKKILKSIRKERPKEQIAVFLENSPFAAATACAALRKKLDLACYSITIDTPFTRAFSGKGVRGAINYRLFQKGQRALRRFDGLISFTEAVKKDLQVEIPFCQLAIGCEERALPEKISEVTSEKTAVYAGTLIYYNGIRELLDAYVLLGPEYQLHIYGYGPLEPEVKAAAQKHSNIIFHGRFAPEDTMRILSEYNLLINPRLVDPSIENYTFPSKLVDYILTGKSVLSSDFKTLPSAYREFVYILDDMKPETIADNVRKVFSAPQQERRERGKTGARYIMDHQTYDKVAEKIVRFMDE